MSDCYQLECQQDSGHPASSNPYLSSHLGDPPPELFDLASVGRNLSSLVTEMHVNCWIEMQGYAQVRRRRRRRRRGITVSWEGGSPAGSSQPLNASSLSHTFCLFVHTQVVKHWTRFGPDLEAAVCRVLRTVLEALKKKYALPAPLPPAAGGLGGLQQQQQQQEAMMYGGEETCLSLEGRERVGNRWRGLRN